MLIPVQCLVPSWRVPGACLGRIFVRNFLEIFDETRKKILGSIYGEITEVFSKSLWLEVTFERFLDGIAGETLATNLGVKRT